VLLTARLPAITLLLPGQEFFLVRLHGQEKVLDVVIIRTALPTQNTSGHTSLLLATLIPLTRLGRPSQMDDLTMIPEGDKHNISKHLTVS
jgi:hypothetical protein